MKDTKTYLTVKSLLKTSKLKTKTQKRKKQQ